MKKTKAIIIPVVFVLISLIVVFIGFSDLNIFPYIDFGEILGVNKIVDSSVRVNSQIIEDLKNTYINDNPTELPDDMNALWIDINKDLQVSAEDGTDAVKYCIYSDIDFYKNFVPDTYFIKPDTENEFSDLLEPDGTNYDVLAYLLYYVRDVDCRAVLVADESILFDDNDKISTKQLEYYLENYKFDGVLISVDTLISQKLYSDCVKSVASFIDEKYPSLFIGSEFCSDFDKVFADEYVTDVVQNGVIDFGYVDIKCTSADAEYPFQSVALWWNYFAEYYSLPLYCEMRLDKIFSSEGDWSYSTEINNQLDALKFCQEFDGYCFYNASQLKNKKALSRELAIYINDVAGKNDDHFEVNSLSLAGSDVIFTGTAADNASVFCNDLLVRVDEGKFEYSDVLFKGLNKFKFFSNGAYYTYDVYDNSSLFYTYSSGADARINADMTVDVAAVCPAGSKVFAVVNGESFELTECQSQSSSARRYSEYSAIISLYGKEIYYDELQLICFYNNNYETVDCGSIRFEINSDDENVISSVASPFSDNGLGTSLMCITKDDNTEIISEVNDYNTYHPYNSSLLTGTIDYVDNINVSSEGYLRYELKSGLNVYGTDAILINNGYNLPVNHVLLTERSIASEYTSFTFNLQWLAPVTVTLKDLDYYKGYQEFAFNIDEFDAEYVDINFYYSDNFSLGQQMILENDPLFTSYELYADAEKSVLTLRLYLRNKGEFYGYDIVSGENGDVRIVFKNFESNSLAGKVVMLDAGHGGISMVGTALNDNSVSESQITLGIAHAAKKYLESMGAKVIMTRIMDTSLSLSERTYMCEKENPDIFVSIHCDGADDITESGTHTFYFTPFSMNLASSIHNSIVKAYSEKIYLPADENFHTIDRKIKYYPFYVTRVDNCPSVLVETGFLTNYVEGNVLANPVNQDIIGNAVAQGINNYFAEN